MMGIGGAEIVERLREVGGLSDLTTGRRLESKVSMDPGAICARLQRQSELRRLCSRLRALSVSQGSFVGPGTGSGGSP